MKIIPAPKEFQPFDIRVESEAEAKLLATLLGNIRSEIVDAVAPGANVQSMYQLLFGIGHRGVYGIDIELTGGDIRPV